jgi:hypothetical protein
MNEIVHVWVTPDEAGGLFTTKLQRWFDRMAKHPEKATTESVDVDDLVSRSSSGKGDQRQFIRLGPMWQFECKRCHQGSQCFSSEAEREEAMDNHRCWAERRFMDR